MLYDEDIYLNGLDPNVHPGYSVPYPQDHLAGEYHAYYQRDFCFREADYNPGASPFSCEEKIVKTFSDEVEKSRKFLPGYHPFPINYEIFKIWHYAKENCTLNNENINLYPDNECLNQRFGRVDEPVGKSNCRQYYFWDLEVTSRPCMIKNAKLEEIDLYQICGADSAFLCTKISVTIKQEKAESTKIARSKAFKEIFDVERSMDELVEKIEFKYRGARKIKGILVTN